MPVLAENKRALFDYEILETHEAGIELKGFEVKSIAAGRFNLAGSYAIIRGGEIWLINADIPPYQAKNTPLGYNPKQNRRLLLKKDEINALAGKLKEKKLTLLPLKVYTKNNRIKVELGLGRGLKKKDKRELIKKRETAREIRKHLGT